MFKDVLDNFKDIGNEIKKLPREIIHSDGTDRLPKEIGASLDTAKPDTQSKDVGVNGGEREFLEGTRSVAVSDASCERKIDQQNDTIKRVESGKIALDSTQKKGNYGEMKTDQDLREKGYERISNDMVSDIDDLGHKGIDGVYYNPDSQPKYLIVDSKYGTAQLAETADGKQMSDNWIDKRLDDSVGKEKADEIRMEKLINPENVGSYVARVDENGNVSYDKIDANGNIERKDVNINA